MGATFEPSGFVSLPTTVQAIREALAIDSAALSQLMEFDCPIVIGDDGTVTRAEGVGAPDLREDVLYGDSPYSTPIEPWTLLDGFSGQHGYAGPVMHPSEFIGGGMATAILDRPGIYVAVVAYVDTPNESCDSECDPDVGCDHDISGWAVARSEFSR